MQQQAPAQPPGNPWLYGAGKPAPYSPSQKAFAPKQLQEMPNYYYQPKASVNDDLLASGNKWKLPMMGSATPQQQQQQQQAVPKEQPQKQRSKKGRGSSWGSQGPSRFAQRLYRNEQLQALAAQDQEQQRRAWQLLQQGGRGAGPEAQPGSQQPPRGVASDDEMPTPPGFFASREEAQEFMAWVSAKRAARMKQLEKSHDKEIVGIAAVYLVAALCIIGLSLTSSPL